MSYVSLEYVGDCYEDVLEAYNRVHKRIQADFVHLQRTADVKEMKAAIREAVL